MRNIALTLLAALVMTFSFAVAPASADEKASGQNFSLLLENVDSLASPGDTLSGQLSIALTDPRPGTIFRREVSYVVTVDSPFGEATVLSGDFRMQPGRTRTLPFALPISENAVAGVYTIRITVTVDRETLSVEQTVEIGGKR